MSTSKGLIRFPEYPVTLDRLPLQIGQNVSIEHYNTHLINREKSGGYKFKREANGDVYIVDMATTPHECVAQYLSRCFDAANGPIMYNGPVVVGLQSYHFGPGGGLIAGDVAVMPYRQFVQAPILGVYPPPYTEKGYPHARIVCEVGFAQGTGDLHDKCGLWLQEPYVRYVLGINIFDRRTGANAVNALGQFNRTMIARLYQQGAPAPGFIQWDFGTLQFGSQVPTLCTAPGLLQFQINIPVAELFWDPPIINGAPNLLGYVPVAPGAVIGPNFTIDLYAIQQIVLDRDVF